MSEERKPQVWPWIVALLIGLPVLYALSSGPMHGVAFPNGPLIGFAPDGRMIFPDEQGWWPRVYAPLVWASKKSWGKPLRKYWNHFPLVRNIE